jgi:hypothetical protein
MYTDCLFAKSTCSTCVIPPKSSVDRYNDQPQGLTLSHRICTQSSDHPSYIGTDILACGSWIECCYHPNIAFPDCTLESLQQTPYYDYNDRRRECALRSRTRRTEALPGSYKRPIHRRNPKSRTPHSHRRYHKCRSEMEVLAAEWPTNHQPTNRSTLLFTC